MRRIPHIDNVEVRRAIQRLSSDTTGVEDAIGSLNGSVADIKSDITEIEGDIAGLEAGAGINSRVESAECAENINAGQFVYKLAGLTTIGVARHSTSGKRRACGVAIESKVTGQALRYALYGSVELDEWPIEGESSFTPGTKCYLGDGTIMETPPTTGAVCVIGDALNETTLNVRLEPPIIL